MRSQWFNSTNAKEIGTLYLIFAVFAGMIGTAFSVLIRLELAAPGVQVLSGDHQLFNVIISAHAFIMIFFMVDLKKTDLNSFSFYNKNFIKINNKNKAIKNFSTLSKNYKSYNINNPFENKKIISDYAKNKKGVYIFELLNKNLYYVGSSINLYNRVCSYFMPSILKKADRKVLRYLNKYGFKDVNLILHILEDECNIEEILDLEKFFIDSYSKNNLLNIETIPGSGFHLPMSEEARVKLRKLRGKPFYIYDTLTKSLIFIFDSKQYAYDNINIDHRTLNNCLNENYLYLNRFMFSIEPIKEFVFENIISLNELINLIKEQKYTQKYIQISSKKIYVENIKNPFLNREFESISEFSNSIKGDRGTIRKYINNQTKLYRGQWKITLIKTTD